MDWNNNDKSERLEQMNDLSKDEKKDRNTATEE